MIFEEKKCYICSSEKMVMCVLGVLNTAAFGTTLVAEVLARGSYPCLKPVGATEGHAKNWQEISGTEYLQTCLAWSEELVKAAEQKPAEDLPVEPESFGTSFRKIVTIIEHPQRISKILYLQCGHKVELDHNDFLKLDPVPVKGQVFFCEKCRLQNVAWHNQLKSGGNPEENRAIADQCNRVPNKPLIFTK